MLRFLFVAALTLLSSGGSCQTSTFKLFLIGDTGEDDTLQETMKNFMDTINLYPNSAAVFLGDNSYKKYLFFSEKKGFDGSKVTVERVLAQLNGLANYHGRVYFIPGNHDWWNCTKFDRGQRKLKTEEVFIEDHLRGNQNIKNKDNFLPADGKPIAAVDINQDKLKLIFLDTQWLILKMNKRHTEATLPVYRQLDSLLQEALVHHQKAVVMAHHPIFTIGSHSKTHRFLPLTMLRDQDIYYHSYDSVRNKIDLIISQKKYQPCDVVYASGHDHMLEYFQKDSMKYIVSGAGSKTSVYSKKDPFNPDLLPDIPPMHLARNEEGFFEIDYTGAGQRIMMHAAQGRGGEWIEMK